MGMQILDNIKKLFKEKADNIIYSNGQLQLRSGENNLGGPISVNTQGGLNAFISGITEFTNKATVDTTTFKIPNFNQSMRTELIKDGLTLVRGKDYSIGNDGTVTLIGITLKKDEEINVIISHTAMDYNSLNNKPDLNLKADAIHTHPYAPNNYGLGTSCIQIADVHKINANGWYMGANVANAPSADWWMFKATVHNALWIEIEAVQFTATEPEKTKRIKYMKNGAWGAWVDPFGVVANGKQKIVNAISGAIGYNSGLTINNSFDDYAWWIQNKTSPPFNLQANSIIQQLTCEERAQNIGVSFALHPEQHFHRFDYDVVNNDRTVKVVTVDFPRPGVYFITRFSHPRGKIDFYNVSWFTESFTIDSIYDFRTKDIFNVIKGKATFRVSYRHYPDAGSGTIIVVEEPNTQITYALSTNYSAPQNGSFTHNIYKLFSA